jgi:hypothetical protein
MTSAAPAVVAALAALSGIDVRHDELASLAEALADQALRVQPLLELDVGETALVVAFDPRWERVGGPIEIATRHHP